LLDIFKTKIIYIQVKTDEMIFQLIGTDKIITLTSEESYGDNRLLISKFSVAEKLIYDGFGLLIKRAMFAPYVVIHPMENINTPLSEVEEKIFQECALSAGAKTVRVHIGKVLIESEILEMYPVNNRFDIKSIFLLFSIVWLIYKFLVEGI